VWGGQLELKYGINSILALVAQAGGGSSAEGEYLASDLGIIISGSWFFSPYAAARIGGSKLINGKKFARTTRATNPENV
jgi:hypothetical protein